MKRILIAMILIVFLFVFVACQNIENAATDMQSETGTHSIFKRVGEKIKETNELWQMLVLLTPHDATPAEEEQTYPDSFAKMDYDEMDRFIRDFWAQNREILETIAAEMKEQGIVKISISESSVTVEYSDRHISHSVGGSEAMRTILDWCKEEPLIDGMLEWKSPYDPLFTNQSEYFCFMTKMFYDDHHHVYKIRLVYSHNSEEDLKEYIDHVQLAQEWIMVVDWYE